MRAFIAIEISEELKGALERIESHLKYAGADIKWAKPDSIHLTLKFLGDITEEQRKEISGKLDEISKSVQPFDVTLKDIGAFPKIEHPRVIWVGLDNGAAQSVEIASRVEAALSTLGFAKEDRAFSPHLTIGRVRSSHNVDKLKEKIPGAASDILSSGEIVHRVASIVLFQSTLTPHGSIYTKLHESAFRA